MNKYEFQKDCLAEMQKNDVGKIILPTGSGKTRIEFEYAKSKLKEDDGVHQIIIVVAPTIILCQQLMHEFYDFFSENGKNKIKERFIFVSCGEVPKYIKDEGIAIETLDPEKISAKLSKHRKISSQVGENDTVIFSTYRSFDKCIKGVKDSLQDCDKSEVYLLADEAHYFVKKNGDQNGKSFLALKNNIDLFSGRFFFTATPKVRKSDENDDEDDSAMDNESVYGKTIFSLPPKDLISTGVICSPLVHRIVLKEEDKINYDKKCADIIIDLFEAHENKINENSDIQIGAKVIVCVDSGDQLLSIKDNKKFKQWVQKENIAVAWTMSDNDIGSFFNYKKCKSMDVFLKTLKEYCADGTNTFDNRRLIIFHYNQLTEGVDVPVITGILPLRSMSKEKIIQSIGRGLRTHPKDRAKEFNGNYDGWVKPFTYVMFPKVEELKHMVESTIKEIRDNFNPNILIETVDVVNGNNEKEDNKHSSKILRSLQKYRYHEFEEYLKAINKVREQINNNEIISTNFTNVCKEIRKELDDKRT